MTAPNKTINDLTVQNSTTGPNSGPFTEVITVSSNQNTSGSGIYLVDTSGGARTLTLDSNDVANNELIGVANISGANDVTVDTEGSETIDPNGDSSKTLSTGGWLVWFEGDGSNWDSSLDVDAESITVGDLNIGSADFLDSGDFAALGPTWNSDESNAFSTTSTSFVTTDVRQSIQWDTWAPANAQTAALSTARTTTSTGDWRLQNLDDSETVHTASDVATATALGPTNYTPTTTASVIELTLQVRTNDGGTATQLDRMSVVLGVQV